MMEKVIEILCNICGAEPEELEPEMNLFEEGLLDSFGVVQLLVELEEQIGVGLDIAVLTREDIATPALIAQRMEQEKSA